MLVRELFYQLRNETPQTFFPIAQTKPIPCSQKGLLFNQMQNGSKRENIRKHFAKLIQLAEVDGFTLRKYRNIESFRKLHLCKYKQAGNGPSRRHI